MRTFLNVLGNVLGNVLENVLGHVRENVLTNVCKNARKRHEIDKSLRAKRLCKAEFWRIWRSIWWNLIITVTLGPNLAGCYIEVAVLLSGIQCTLCIGKYFGTLRADRYKQADRLTE